MAKVSLDNAQQGLHCEATTGSTGEYDFPALQPGTYVLAVQMTGFRKYEQQNFQLLVNLPATVNVALEVGATSQTVEVSAQTETLNTTDASLGIAFDENQIKQLPLEAGNIPELLSLQAGVTYTGNRPDFNKATDTRNGAVNGARSDQSNITLDGVDVNSDTKGYAFQSVLPVTQDSVQEFRVTTSNYNADEGRSSGAQMALVTKGGTNDFHGSLFELHRNTATSANDYFIKLADLQGGAPNEAPKLIRNIFGGSVGGPIKKDRLFFFLNYQGGRQREAQSVVRIVPSAAMQDGVIQYQC
jgi:carboxypeptidase family protein